MNKNIESVLLSEQELKERVKELGRAITEDYGDESILAICILKGSVVFYSDLIREIGNDVEMAFIAASSYASEAVSSGTVEVTNIMEIPVKGRNILLVEDIVDSGRTLSRIKAAFENDGAKSIKIAALLDKPERRVVDVDVEYSGFNIPNEFVVGYGLDYAQRFRNLPYIGILKREVYEKPAQTAAEEITEKIEEKQAV